MSTELCQIGRNSFDKKSPVLLSGDVASQIRVLPGYQTEISFKKFQDKPRLVVNVDTMSKVLSQFSALSIIQQEVGVGRSTKITNPAHKSQIKMKLVGNVVYTSYVFQEIIRFKKHFFDLSLVITTLHILWKALSLACLPLTLLD